MYRLNVLMLVASTQVAGISGVLYSCREYSLSYATGGLAILLVLANCALYIHKMKSRNK